VREAAAAVSLRLGGQPNLSPDRAPRAITGDVAV